MKKLFLTSAIVLAAGAANAANVMDNNPLYRPDAGRFYSVTDLTTVTGKSADFRNWALDTEFGYGITDKLAVSVNTGVDMLFPKGGDTTGAWNNFGLGLNYRILNDRNWKADVYGKLNVGEVWGDHAEFLDKDLTFYNWTAGVRGGYVAGDWTLAGLFEFDYLSSEAFNRGDEDLRTYTFGVDGQYAFDSNWSVSAGLRYIMIEDNPIDDPINGILGINYNIDATKFVGAYVGKQLNPESGDDRMLWGLRFGIDF